jgi:hypothetical protein
MINKLKKIFFNTKTLIIVLAVLVLVGAGLSVYFGIKANSDKGFCTTCEDRLQKLNYYAALLDNSLKLTRAGKSLDVLEENVRLLDNGVLLAEWENVVFGGNKPEDVNNYIDVIVDALKIFSK